MAESIAQPVPGQRIDTFVHDADTGAKVRRTDYCGTVWYGAPPDTGGAIVAFSRTHVRDDTPFFLPDSHPYQRSELGDAVVTCSVALQAHNGQPSFVNQAEAIFADDPRGGDQCWIALRIAIYGLEPLAVSYRVTTICPTRAVPSSRVVDLRGAFGGG